MGAKSVTAGPTFLKQIYHDAYVANMCYRRMKPDTKVRWLRNFRSTLRHTIYLVNKELEVWDDGYFEDPEVEASELRGFVEMTAADVKVADQIQVIQTMFGGFTMGETESATVTGITRPEEEDNYPELVRIYHDGPSPNYGESEEGDPVWVRR